MNSIFEIAANISTPLGLSGFFAAVLFFTLRQLIKRNTFPALTKSASADVIKQIMDRLFILALVAMVLGFAGYVIPKPKAPTFQKILSPKITHIDPLSQQLTAKLYRLWINKHPEVIEQYGQPKSFKFINIHEQHFKTGYIAYNVTDGWSVLLYRINKEYRQLQNPGVHLTPGSGREVNEKLFEELTLGMSDVDRSLYRSLIDRRVKSDDFQGIGIIGGIATLYIRERLHDAFGNPEENEKLIRDVLDVTGDKYKVLVGLPHVMGDVVTL